MKPSAFFKSSNLKNLLMPCKSQISQLQTADGSCKNADF